MSLWSWITGGSKAAEKAADGIYNGLDKLVFTDEEKADANRQGFQMWLEYLKATQPQNVARRLIALVLVGLFAALVVVGVMAWPFSREYASFIFDVINKLVMTPVTIIIGFYFVKHIAAQFGKRDE